MNKWLKLMIPDGDNGGSTPEPSTPAIAPEPSTANDSASTSPTPAESITETPTDIPERTSPITADVAEKLGVSTAKPIDVKPLAALGLDKTPRTAINDLLAKDAAKITRNIPFEKKPVSGGPAAKPAASMQQPAAQVAPTPTPAAPALVVTPQVPAPVVQKYNVGGREMTAEQMAAYLEGVNRAQPQPQPVQQPQQTQPVLPQRSQQEIRQLQANFVAQAAPTVDLDVAGLRVTPEQADVIAQGGEPAVNLLNQMNQRAVAYANLTTREQLAGDLNPIIKAHAETIAAQYQDYNQKIAPLLEAQRSVNIYQTEQEFAATYPDLVPYIDTARIIGQQIAETDPAWVASATRPEFLALIAEHVPQVLGRFGVTIAPKTAATANNVAPATSVAPKAGTTASGVKKVATSSGPKPIAGQAPGKQHGTAVSEPPTQTRKMFQRVGVDSISSLR